MSDYYGILTTAGAAVCAQSVETGLAANISTFVIGDGNGSVPLAARSGIRVARWPGQPLVLRLVRRSCRVSAPPWAALSAVWLAASWARKWAR